MMERARSQSNDITWYYRAWSSSMMPSSSTSPSPSIATLGRQVGILLLNWVPNAMAVVKSNSVMAHAHRLFYIQIECGIDDARKRSFYLPLPLYLPFLSILCLRLVFSTYYTEPRDIECITNRKIDMILRIPSTVRTFHTLSINGIIVSCLPCTIPSNGRLIHFGLPFSLVVSLSLTHSLLTCERICIAWSENARNPNHLFHASSILIRLIYNVDFFMNQRLFPPSSRDFFSCFVHCCDIKTVHIDSDYISSFLRVCFF